MLLLLSLVALTCGMFFYCQALMSGLNSIRWGIAGIFLGPVVWPMFCMKKRMQVTKIFGFDCLIFCA